MGLIIRSAVVIGTIFAVSPVHDRVPTGSGEPARTAAAKGAEQALEAAQELCGPGLSACIVAVMQALQSAQTLERNPQQRPPPRAGGSARGTPAP
jgi:hypothetical protein